MVLAAQGGLLIDRVLHNDRQQPARTPCSQATDLARGWGFLATVLLLQGRGRNSTAQTHAFFSLPNALSSKACRRHPASACASQQRTQPCTWRLVQLAHAATVFVSCGWPNKAGRARQCVALGPHIMPSMYPISSSSMRQGMCSPSAVTLPLPQEYSQAVTLGSTTCTAGGR